MKDLKDLWTETQLGLESIESQTAKAQQALLCLCAPLRPRPAILNVARWVVGPVAWAVALPVIARAAARGTKLVADDRAFKAHALRVVGEVARVAEQHEAFVIRPATRHAGTLVTRH